MAFACPPKTATYRGDKVGQLGVIAVGRVTFGKRWSIILLNFLNDLSSLCASTIYSDRALTRFRRRPHSLSVNSASNAPPSASRSCLRRQQSTLCKQRANRSFCVPILYLRILARNCQKFKNLFFFIIKKIDCFIKIICFTYFCVLNISISS